MDWADSVKNAILRSSKKHNSSIVTRQNIVNEELDRIESETQTIGQTPAQTLSRILQNLRESGFIKFLGRGEYAIIGSAAPVIVVEPPILSVDIGEPSATERQDITTTRIIRDTKIVHRLKEKYKHCCQICGNPLDLGSRLYSEAHHIKPLGIPHAGPDHESNIIIVCPNHHVMLDFGAIRLIMDDLKLSLHNIDSKYIQYHNDVVMNEFIGIK